MKAPSADDLLVMRQTRQEAGRGLQALTAILAELGLELKQAKTRIVHLTEDGDGLDFLGFHHRWVRVGAAVCSGPTAAWKSESTSQQMNSVMLVPAGVGTV